MRNSCGCSWRLIASRRTTAWRPRWWCTFRVEPITRARRGDRDSSDIPCRIVTHASRCRPQPHRGLTAHWLLLTLCGLRVPYTATLAVGQAAAVHSTLVRGRPTIRMSLTRLLIASLIVASRAPALADRDHRDRRDHRDHR